MFPGIRSIIKIGLVLFILWAYLKGPDYFATPENRPLTVNLGRLKQVIINTDKNIIVMETQDGHWKFDPPSAYTPDPAIINNLTWFLGNCRFELSDRDFAASTATVTLKDTVGRKQKIELGPRLIPFRKQLIRIDDHVFEINKDISACLGFWNRMYELKLVQQLGSAKAFDLKDDVIRDLEFANAIAVYHFQNRGGHWALVNAPKALVRGEKMRGYLEKFSWLSAFTPASRYVPDDLTYPFQLKFTTDKGLHYEMTFSEPFGQMMGSVATKMTYPKKKSFIIDSSSFYRLSPNVPNLIANMPGFSADPKQLSKVKVKRPGGDFTLENQDGRWTMTKPSIPLKEIMMIEGMESGKKMPATSAYVESIATIRTSELFTKSTSRDTVAIKKALAKSDGTIEMKWKNGKRTKLTVSPVVAGTEDRFVSVGKNVILVVSDDFHKAMFPDPDSFRKKER